LKLPLRAQPFERNHTAFRAFFDIFDFARNFDFRARARRTVFSNRNLRRRLKTRRAFDVAGRSFFVIAGGFGFGVCNRAAPAAVAFFRGGFRLVSGCLLIVRFSPRRAWFARESANCRTKKPELKETRRFWL
jgi:hypothetical protein